MVPGLKYQPRARLRVVHVKTASCSVAATLTPNRENTERGINDIGVNQRRRI